MKCYTKGIMNKITAFQLSEQINLKALKSAYVDEPVHVDSAELWYKNEHDQHIQVLVYGVVVFQNYDAIKMSEFLDFATGFCKNMLKDKLSEELELVVGSPELRIGYNTISLPRHSDEALRLVMLHVAQSVALDYYTALVDELLENTRGYTQQLELTGKLGISGKDLRQYIGKTLNLKNRIVENLYILDSPSVTWEDEYLNDIDRGLKRTFDLSIRYRTTSEDLQIIKENLDLFKDLMMHRTSNILEWIIIVLILVEVINLFAEKVF